MWYDFWRRSSQGQFGVKSKSNFECVLESPSCFETLVRKAIGYKWGREVKVLFKIPPCFVLWFASRVKIRNLPEKCTIAYWIPFKKERFWTNANANFIDLLCLFFQGMKISAAVAASFKCFDKEKKFFLLKRCYCWKIDLLSPNFFCSAFFTFPWWKLLWLTTIVDMINAARLGAKIIYS